MIIYLHSSLAFCQALKFGLENESYWATVEDQWKQNAAGAARTGEGGATAGGTMGGGQGGGGLGGGGGGYRVDRWWWAWRLEI